MRLNKQCPWSRWRGAWTLQCLLPSPASGYKWLTSVSVPCGPSRPCGQPIFPHEWSRSPEAQSLEVSGRHRRPSSPWLWLISQPAPHCASFSSVNGPLTNDVTPRDCVMWGEEEMVLQRGRVCFVSQKFPDPLPCPHYPPPPPTKQLSESLPFASRNYRP